MLTVRPGLPTPSQSPLSFMQTVEMASCHMNDQDLHSSFLRLMAEQRFLTLPSISDILKEKRHAVGSQHYALYKRTGLQHQGGPASDFQMLEKNGKA